MVVVEPTQRCEVAVARRAAGVVGDAVVLVAAAWRSRAPREDARGVDQAAPLVQPVGDFVGVGADVICEVDHRLDQHVGATRTEVLAVDVSGGSDREELISYQPGN